MPGYIMVFIGLMYRYDSHMLGTPLPFKVTLFSTVLKNKMAENPEANHSLCKLLF